MSILIKGMEMPSSCDECPFGKKRPKEYHCYTLNRSISHAKWFDDIADGCPLVEVPEPHGRLIDADKLPLCMEDFDDRPSFRCAFDTDIEAAPTVIEAEEQAHEV